MKPSIVRRNARLIKALPVFVEFIGGPEQGLRCCFADVTNRGLNYICYAGYPRGVWVYFLVVLRGPCENITEPLR